MKPRFIAEPPKPVPFTSFGGHLRQMLVRLGFILWQIVVPFNSRPQEIESLPEPTVEVSDAHVEQCQWIFNQAEERRVRLEEKAQSTFTLMVFLVPLLASLFGFLISKSTISGTGIRTIAISLLIVSAIVLLLAFISAVRAVSVKDFDSLFVYSVVDEETGEFRQYSKAFHARGLLWCAAMNEAMNDHIAQFVKGAHIFTAAAVVVLLVAALPIGLLFSHLPSSPPATTAKIVGPVNVVSQELTALADDFANLQEDVAKVSNSNAMNDRIKGLEERVAKLEARLREIHRATPVHPTNKTGGAQSTRGSLSR